MLNTIKAIYLLSIFYCLLFKARYLFRTSTKASKWISISKFYMNLNLINQLIRLLLNKVMMIRFNFHRILQCF